jgi:hypothetical protein
MIGIARAAAHAAAAAGLSFATLCLLHGASAAINPGLH